MEPPGGQPPDRDRQLMLRTSQDNSQQQQQQQLVPFQPVKPTSLNLPLQQQLISVATSPAASTHAAATSLIAHNTTLTSTNTNTATVQAHAATALTATTASASVSASATSGIGIGISNNATTAAAAAVAAGTSPALASTATAISATTQAATAFSGSSVAHHHQQHHHHHLPTSLQQQQQQQQLPALHHHPHIAHHTTGNTAALLGSSNSGVSGSSSSATQQQATIEKLSRPMAFDKMESLVREMQDPEHGVPVRQQKMFLTSIPYAFMGYDLIEWLMDRLLIEESEALNIANQLCLHGYFFPVNDSKTLTVKDDSSLYRFQTPYYWPWQHKTPDNVEYAIYLAKRSLRNKQRHALEDYEAEALASLHKNLKGKWEFISMQADEQVRLAKERKKGDKIVGDSQERAYWRVHRPPPGQFTPLEPCPVPSRDRQGLKPNKKKTVDDIQREVDYLKKSLNRTRMKMSQACESLVTYSETFVEYDFFLQPVLPSNPWVTEDITFWQLNNTFVDIPTEKRVKRWAISIEELVADPTGLQEFTSFLEKEYSHENIRFWIAVNRLRRSAHSQVARKVNDIFEEFLKPGAPCEINIDGKTMESVLKGLKNPSRFTFDSASEHIYMLLLKKDCYPRFIRSEHYKRLLESGIQPSHKKRFFNFGGVSGAKKKMTAALSSQPNLGDMVKGSGGTSGSSASGGMMQAPPPGNLSRRRGSDRSLTGSAHELAVIGVNKDKSNNVPHSHSQSNLSEMPYSSDTIYRGDMPQRHMAAVMDAGIYAAYGNRESSLHTLQETPKSKPVRLETTVESTCSAVCPWDEPYSTPAPVAVPMPASQAPSVIAPIPAAVSATVPVNKMPASNDAAAAQVKLSICPWEQEPVGESTISSTGTSAGKLNTQRLTSTSSDISDVAERLQRNLGIRHQNTVDSGEAGMKRLMPNFTEQRRASVSFTQGRLSEYQFGRSALSVKPVTVAAAANALEESQNQSQSQSSVSTNFPPQFMASLPTTAKSSSALDTSKQITKDPPSTSDDEVENLLGKLALNTGTGTELPPVLPSHSVSPAQMQSHTATPTPTPPPVTKITPSPDSNANLGNPIEQQLKESPQNESLIGESETVAIEIGDGDTAIATELIDEHVAADQDSDVVPLVKEVQIELIETRVYQNAGEEAADSALQRDLKVVVTTPTIQVQEPTQANPSLAEQQLKDDNEDQPEEIGVITFEASSPAMASVSTNTSPPERIGIPGEGCGKDKDKDLQMREDTDAPEELSPTTDEYQEGLQFGVDDKDVYGVYDIGEGDIEGGYIPPAPTPAPFMAPLAVLDVDTVDDEPCEEYASTSTVNAEIEPIMKSVQAEVNVSTPTMEEVRRKRKKRNSESKKMSSLEDKEREKDRERAGSSGGGGGSGAVESGTKGGADHNTVCPWEDENVTTSDGTFVKTYATLGYL